MWNGESCLLLLLLLFHGLFWIGPSLLIPFLFFFSLFLFSQVENISNLLNSGEVPNMLSGEDIAAAVEAVRPAAKADRKFMKEIQLASSDAAGGGGGKVSTGRIDPTPNQLFQYWKNRCRANLHVVLAFSPVGETFRTRCVYSSKMILFFLSLSVCLSLLSTNSNIYLSYIYTMFNL